METLFVDFIEDTDIPKGVRFFAAALICAFVFAIGVCCAAESAFVYGRVLGVLICAFAAWACAYLYGKIFRAKAKTDRLPLADLPYESRYARVRQYF